MSVDDRAVALWLVRNTCVVNAIVARGYGKSEIDFGCYTVSALAALARAHIRGLHDLYERLQRTEKEGEGQEEGRQSWSVSR